VSAVAITRARILPNGSARERYLLGWVRAVLYAATFGLTVVNVVLYFWLRRGSVWKDQAAADNWGVYAMGMALIMLGSAVFILGLTTDVAAIKDRRGQRRRTVFSFAIAAGLGMVGLFGTVVMLAGAWTHRMKQKIRIGPITKHLCRGCRRQRRRIAVHAGKARRTLFPAA
jgi:uncharacterized membrane protein YidH (DUF202 family)